jgi:etoposide-induced 2.4 mRNA
MDLIINELISGIKDSCNYVKAAQVLLQTRSAHKPLFLSTWLTGFVFLGSILIHLYILDPIFKGFPRFERAFTTLYHLCWLFPLYSLCFILNIFTYSDISLSVFKLCRGRPKSPALSLSRAIACEIHRGLIMALYLVFMTVFALVPYSEAAIIGLMSWVYSFYCFEYRWMFEGKTINKEIKKIEFNAVYYLGFGLPFALITYSFPGLMGNGVWAVLFPIFSVTAILSQPPEKPTVEIPVFRYVNLLCDKLEVVVLGKISNS